MLRLDFLVDGFNLYHSIREAESGFAQQGKQRRLRWLDLRRLLVDHIHVARQNIGRVEIGKVYYFTALAHHRVDRSPNCVSDHQAYIEALKEHGVQVELGRFKRAGPRRCRDCGATKPRHEEKETDVHIAVRLLELFVADRADAVVLVSGDTDLVPAIKSARRLFPERHVGCLFPFKRKNQELAQACSFSANIAAPTYAKHQLPPTVSLRSGREVQKPEDW